VSGIEPNKGYADYSIREYGLTVQVGFAQDATFPPESFDVVTIWHVLEHTEDPGFILALLRSWLKPDGTLVVEVPNVEATCQAPRRTFHEAHLYDFNIVSLRRLARKHGLYETKHLISRDGGNITMFLTRIEPLIEDHYEAAIPGNYEWVSRIVRQHSNLRRYLTPLPYVRVWQRLCRSLMERRETQDATTGKVLLDTLYSSQLPILSMGRL
jgi:SAM-dependent methyltransferase